MNVQQMIDRLGNLKAKRELIEKEERMLKAALIANGIGLYQGDKYIAEVQRYERATISPTLVRKLVNDEMLDLMTEHKMVDAVVLKAKEPAHA